MGRLELTQTNGQGTDFIKKNYTLIGILPRFRHEQYPGTHFLGTAGYRVPRKFQKIGTARYCLFVGTVVYRVPAGQNFLGTDGYWVPAKFSTMPTPDFATN